MRITATGGVYIRALPQGVNISVDSKIINKAGLFSNAFFVQNLTPGQHRLLTSKEGYHDYQKNLLVKENEVTKLEHIILFKNNINFEFLENTNDYFSMAPNNARMLTVKNQPGGINFTITSLVDEQKKEVLLYVVNGAVQDTAWSQDSGKVLLHIGNNYFLLNASLEKPTINPLPHLTESGKAYFNPENSDELFFIKSTNLYSSNSAIPLVRNIITYNISNNNIIWLSSDGFLYSTNLLEMTTVKVSMQNFPLKKNTSYEIILTGGSIFLTESESLFLLNKDTGIFENFYHTVKGMKASPNGQKILYCNDHEIIYSFLNSNNTETILLNRFSKIIGDCYWLNEDYVVFSLGDKLMISEINIQDNINMISLPEVFTLPDGNNIAIKNPEIFVNQQDKKIYFLTEKTLLATERLLP